MLEEEVPDIYLTTRMSSVDHYMDSYKVLNNFERGEGNSLTITTHVNLYHSVLIDSAKKSVYLQVSHGYKDSGL